MCWEDEQIIRRVESGMFSMNLTAADQTVFGKDVYRRSFVIIGATHADTVVSVIDDDGNSFSVLSGVITTPVVFHQDDYGDLVTKLVVALNLSAAGSLTAASTRLPYKDNPTHEPPTR